MLRPFTAAFTTVPLRLFRVSPQRATRLRQYDPRRPGSFDIVLDNGNAQPKYLDPQRYNGPNGASMRPSISFNIRLLSNFNRSDAVVYEIPAGTPLPDDLILVLEHADHHSLQARREMPIDTLNQKITDFLESSSRIWGKDSWLNQYDKPRGSRAQPAHLQTKRARKDPSQFSKPSIYHTFPATLMRLNAGPAYKPLPRERPSQHDNSFTENPSLRTEGWEHHLACGPAPLMPNTFWMQEVMRRAYDNYEEDTKKSICAEKPFLFIVYKGTIVPPRLRLLRLAYSEFSLQVSSQDSHYNNSSRILEEFYSTNAKKHIIADWLRHHPYEDAVSEADEKEWMKH